MGINELEFQWRLNWWYRPTQCDGFGSSVTDYYECFCDWKDSMTMNSCPADESDYVNAFIQNLKPDIRLRLESKGRSSTRRLGDAFYDAKLEESLISIDEAFKKIKANFEAHKLFDKLPSQGSVTSVYQEHSSDSFSNELAENLSDAEFLDHDESSCSEEETSIIEIQDQVSENDDYSSAIENEASLKGNAESSELKEVLESAIMSCSDAIVPSDDDVVVQIQTVPEKFLSPNADHKVFDDLLHPIFIQTAGCKLVERVSNVDSWPNSQAETTFDQNLGNSSEDKVLKWLNKATGIQLMKVEGSFLTKQTYLKIDEKVFDEMPRLFFVEAKEKINGGMDSITLIDCVPRVFDPGSVTTKNVYKNESSIKEREGKFTPPLMPSSISLKDICAAVTLNTPFQNLGMKDELSQPSVIATAGSKFFSGKSYSIFDPGISISFKDIRAATSLHNELFQPSITATTCLKSNSGQCYSFATFLGQCKTFSFTSNDMVIIFDPGGRKNGIHNLGSNQHSKVMEENTAIAFLENTSSNGETREHLIMFGHPNAVFYVSWLFESILEIFGDFRSWHLKGCACIYSREILCNLVVFIQIGRVVMVVFNPGGGCWDYMDIDHSWPSHHVECNAFKYNKYSVFPNVCKTDYAGFNIHISPASYGFRFYTGWTIYNIYEHHLEPRKQLVGNFRIGMLAGSCHFPEGRFPGVHKNVVIILESFVWDPGLGVIFSSSLPSHMLCWCTFSAHSLFCTSLGTRMVLRGRERGWLCIEEDIMDCMGDMGNEECCKLVCMLNGC